MRSMMIALALAAGISDTLTGLLLIGAPTDTLALLGIAAPTDPMMVRFIGNFVLGVGLSTLYPLMSQPRRRWHRLAVAFEVASLVRLLVAIFLGSAILSQLLATAWWIVAACDLTLATLMLIARPKAWDLARDLAKGNDLDDALTWSSTS